MSDFLVALGLVLMIEGIVFAAVPGPAKRALASIVDSPDQFLRLLGLLSAVLGLLMVWVIRG